MKFITAIAAFAVLPAFPPPVETWSCIKELNFNSSTAGIPVQDIMLETNAAAGDIALVALAIEYSVSGQVYTLKTNGGCLRR